MVWLTIIAVSVVVAIFYYKAVKPLAYWERRGIAHKKSLPLVGNTISMFFSKKHILEYVEDLYKEFPNERYFGVHQFLKRAIYIRDLDLIKRITVKDFDQFIDHSAVVAEDVEPLMGKNLINLKGQRWRDMRATLSPSFTSSKMRIMFTLLSECAQDFTRYFEKQEDDTLRVEMKDIFTRFTNDAIASVAFGLKCDSLSDKTNEFYMMGKDATNFSQLRMFRFILVSISPYLAKMFQITLFPTSVSTFFRSIIKDTIDQREKKGLVRPDMIHLLMEARKGNLRHEDNEAPDTDFASVQESKIHHLEKHNKPELTIEDITAQALIFFFGGFETSATVMSFIGYELAVNPEIQQKLQNEIDETLEECNGKLTYDALQKMKYMDMIVSETLRKWPPGFQTDRLCNNDIYVEPVHPHEKPLVIEKGTVVLIPVVGIHRDPKYFPNPQVFDPERFSDENKHKIEPYSYLPFGSGPRNCIASRFALLENKILIFHLLSKFDIVVIDKTPIPLKLSRKSFNLVPDEGFWVGLRRRTSNEYNAKN